MRMYEQEHSENGYSRQSTGSPKIQGNPPAISLLRSSGTMSFHLHRACIYFLYFCY